LLIYNEKLRKVIDAITSKVVLILGRFTAERKAVLDAMREALRKRDLLPAIFDFAIPASRDVTETVKVLEIDLHNTMRMTYAVASPPMIPA
jgi:hypothetical protein